MLLVNWQINFDEHRSFIKYKNVFELFSILHIEENTKKTHTLSKHHAAGVKLVGLNSNNKMIGEVTFMVPLQ